MNICYLGLVERDLFARSWTCAGRVSDVEQPGAWVRAAASGDDVIVMRGEDLELRAFYNLCRHRGTPLLDGDAGRASAIVCPYHGWTYACSGALANAPSAPDDFDRRPWGLRAVRVATWQGFVFVALDERAPEFAAWMGEIPPPLAEAKLVHARRARRVSWETAASWKLLVANFQESHHFPNVHPELERLTPTGRARTWLPGIARSKWLGGEMDLADGAETVSTSRKLDGRALLVPPERARFVFDAMLFPLMLTSLQPDYFLTYRLEPISEDATRVVAEIFVHASVPEGADLSSIFSFWDVVNAQDRSICERQARGVRSRGFSPGPRIPADEGVHAFEELLEKETA
ncbi:MAG TPA: aromatic ring-hydroxylating dioxygenase subunit alpha [Polyangiaceae bacterium]|jgi:Rieske 2Fe-2S family protein|nr:aromatic ring-hydroxylating dioxygenase subunit alpha [Polyangiaceae bacterium]